MMNRGRTIGTTGESRTRDGVVYARVSSKEQEKEGFSIPAQLKLLREYALSDGIRVVEEYVDVATAKKAGRSSFGEMVGYLHKNPETSIILVEKTDRLYRNLKDWVTLDDLDLEIHFVKESVVLSPDARSSEKFMHGIKVLMAKNYIDKLDGRIDTDFFDRKAAEWRREQDKCLELIHGHQDANQTYLDEGIRLLELAEKAGRLFR